MDKNILIICVMLFFVILISIHLTMNKILIALNKIEVNTRGGRIKHDDNY